MIFFYVFLGFILFLIVLLCCPVKVYVSFENYLVVKAKFLFFSFDLIPAKRNNSEGQKSEKNQFKSHDNKIWSRIKKVFFRFLDFLKFVAETLFDFELFPDEKIKQLATEEDKAQKNEKFRFKSHDNKILSIIKEEGFFGFLRILKLVADILFNSAKKVLKKVHISSFKLYLLVAKDNAADTAIDYARIYALISYAKSVLLWNVDESKYYVEVEPGFDKTECEVDFSSKFYFFPISMLGIALGALCKFVKNMYFNTVSERV